MSISGSFRIKFCCTLRAGIFACRISDNACHG